jgi:CubicO group peptidase (beta-lactamase class C family)
MDWTRKSPSDFEIDAAVLDKAIQFAETNEYKGSRDLRIAILEGFQQEPYHKLMGPVKRRGGPAGMILKNGYLIASWGDTRRVDMTFSVTKSFLSTVAGVAVDQGLLKDASAPVSETIWDGTFDGAHNSKISWAHLLQQNSDWSGDLWGSHDWADRPPKEGGIDDWKMRELLEPGTVMEYNDVRVNVLAYSLTHLWRQPLPQVLKAEIMDPIGASTTWRWFGYDHAWTVIDGVQMQSVTGGGHSGGGLFINTEDMARFGLLFLSRGKWDGTRLLSESWIDAATAPSEPNPNYGYMWWLNQKGSRQWKGVPNSVYYAAGFGGNFIVVCPEQDLVMVLRWLEPSQIESFVQMVYKSLP